MTSIDAFQFGFHDRLLARCSVDVVEAPKKKLIETREVAFLLLCGF